MASVTQRIKQITQPYGGYLKISEFEKKEFIDNKILKEENIYSSLIGLTIDYLTRLMLNTPVAEAFKISLLGAKKIGEEKKAYILLKSIKGIDNSSIYYACKLVGYDICYRTGKYNNVDEIEADTNTINNIKVMVKRSLLFFNEYGPILKNGFTFEGGYTRVVDTGDGDFLTSDTLWDFKVSKNAPTSAHTLQLLIYYLMGTHSIHNEFNSIQKLGIFNPRTNCVYLKNISDIPQETIDAVSMEVIGYNNRESGSDKVQNKCTLSEQNDLLSMAEIMKELSCSRYMVMKYYSEEDLSLVKINSKYYINKYDLINWKNLKKQMEEEESNRQITILIIGIVVLVFIVIIPFMFFDLKFFPQ